MPVFGEAADGAGGDLGGGARSSLHRGDREHDGVFAVGHLHRAGQEADRAAGHACCQPHHEGAVAANAWEAACRHDLAPGNQRQMRGCADDGFDIRIAERGRARAVGPDHLLQIRRQDGDGVTGGKALAHRVEHGDIEEGIVFGRHALGEPSRSGQLAVNALLIKAGGAKVHKP